MKRRALVSAVLVATFAFLIGLRELARSPTVQVFGRLVARVDASERVIALTFDDGPAMEVLNEIIEVLAARRVRATFFVTGAELAAVPDAGRKLVAAGHELGNHTYSHRRMVFKSSGFVRQEVEDTDALIRASGHMGEIYFRPPFGYKLLSLPWFLMRTGRTSVTWDIEPDSYPEVAASSSAIVAHVVERVQPGSIILLHVWYASRQTSLAAVPMIIDELKREGYRFVTLSELLRTT
ncbi:MAG TPA: polysaccharide deacetylase family protein [Candidatus Binatia bacterium]|nr:polysaccharide deacetylase family protein [Candidatus Binatia bacterium]